MPDYNENDIRLAVLYHCNPRFCPGFQNVEKLVKPKNFIIEAAREHGKVTIAFGEFMVKHRYVWVAHNNCCSPDLTHQWGDL